jgi:hypothetical protein
MPTLNGGRHTYDGAHQKLEESDFPDFFEDYDGATTNKPSEGVTLYFSSHHFMPVREDPKSPFL